MRRRFALVAGLVVAFVALPAIALAHGLGGRSDLPVPLEFFLVGAGVALLVSFGALARLWPDPRMQDGPRWGGRGFEMPRWVGIAAGIVGVVFLVMVVLGGLVGDRLARNNIAPITVLVFFWLVLPFLAAVVGNFWSVASPWAVMGRVLHLDERGEPGPGARGLYPAAGAFLAFTWLELVYSDPADPEALAVAALVYTAYIVVWMVYTGVDRTVSGVEGFAVYHRLISAIAPFGSRSRRQAALEGLAPIVDRPAAVARSGVLRHRDDRNGLL